MPEPERDDVGTTGDGLGEGAGHEAAGNAKGRDGSSPEKATNADSPGTIESGESDPDLSQAGGGSVD